MRRRDRKRRAFHGSGYYYGYGRGTRYSYVSQPAPPPQPDPAPAAPSYRDRPVTPKWIHVSSLDGTLGPSGAEGAYADGGFGNNCLSVKTQIMVTVDCSTIIECGGSWGACGIGLTSSCEDDGLTCEDV